MLAHDWTPASLPDLTGRLAVVTGGNSGIGFHTALELARHGAQVTLACRNTDSGAEARAAIGEAVAGAKVDVRRLDLASQRSVQEFAEQWDSPLDLLVNNAGVMTPPRYRETEDGFELQFGTNHLGHFALTGRLLPRLLAARSPRVVTVSSIAHKSAGAGLLEGNPREGYNPQRAYGNSKVANLLFAFELQRLAERHGAALTSTAAHPGVSNTGLVTDKQGLGAIPLVGRVAPLFMRLALQSGAAGAWASLYAATAADPGSYTGPQRFFEQRGPVGEAMLSGRARDEQLAADLWGRSEGLTGVTYSWP